MNTYKYIIGLLLLSLVVSCSSYLEDVNVEPKIEEMVGEKTVSMNFNCKKVDFDVDLNSSTRATSSGEWENGDIIYLLFSCDKGSVPGKAVYNSSTKGWTVTYEGTLTRDKELKLQAYYFDGETVENDGVVTLQPTTGVYHDLEGSYVYPTGDEINAAAHLVPATGRVRFRGTKNQVFSTQGLKHVQSFNLSSFSLIYDENMVELTVMSDNFSLYEYALSTDKSLCISTDIYDFIMISDLKQMKIGRSGVIELPSADSHNGWSCQDKYFVGHDYVDLGLPSGTLWATCNIGAETPEDNGDYFAWGEINGYLSGKTDFSWTTYRYGNSYNSLTKYCDNKNLGAVDNKTALDIEDDAARVIWGGQWRIPSREEVEELIAYTTVEIMSQNSTYKITSKINGKLLIFPLGGCINSPYHGDSGGFWELGGRGFYWSSSFTADHNKSSNGCSGACYMNLMFGSLRTDFSQRYNGLSIRPVIFKP